MAALLPGNFLAVVDGEVFIDHNAFVKALSKTHPVVVRNEATVAANSAAWSRAKGRHWREVPTRVTLTTQEREWLGVEVEVGGRRGQVWSLAHHDALAVVFHDTHEFEVVAISEVRKIADRGQLAEHFDFVEQRYYCATCGEIEGSPYAKSCCTDDNIIEG